MKKSKDIKYKDYKVASYMAYMRGEEFLEAADILLKNSHKLISPVVNAAFSCESFLKAMVIWQDKKRAPIISHKLKDLFELLEPAVQLEIKNRMKISCWDIFIEAADDSFDSWRYLSEAGEVRMVNIKNLLNFARILKNYYESIHPLEKVLVEEQM